MPDMTRRSLLRGALAASAGLALIGGRAMTAEAAPSLPYTAGCFFRSKAAGLPVDAARTTSFRAFMKSFPEQAAVAWPKIECTDTWGVTTWVGSASDPVWRLAGAPPSSLVAPAYQQGWHMADSVADFVPGGTGDRPCVFVDPVLGYTVQFADAVPNRASRTFGGGGVALFRHDSNGLDNDNPKASLPRQNQSSRGRIPDAMTIRPDLLRAAVANGTGLGHVLHCFFVETKSADGFCHPMVKAEGGNDGWGAEGERIAIKGAVDLAARGLTGAALAVARTLQQNGAYIGDNSGSTTRIKAAHLAQYPAGTNLSVDCLKGKVAWDDFVVVQRGAQ